MTDSPETSPPWWLETMNKLPGDLIPLAVIKVRADNSAEQFQAIGEVLIRWLVSQRQVGHIWGLQELLDGKQPRSPCEYFLIPRSRKDLEHGNEPVALLMAKPGADGDAITLSLQAALKKLDSGVSGLTDLDNYCFQNR